MTRAALLVLARRPLPRRRARALRRGGRRGQRPAASRRRRDPGGVLPGPAAHRRSWSRGRSPRGGRARRRPRRGWTPRPTPHTPSPALRSAARGASAGSCYARAARVTAGASAELDGSGRAVPEGRPSAGGARPRRPRGRTRTRRTRPHCAAYESVSGPATAAVRLLSLDPFDATAVLARLAPELDRVADSAVEAARRAARDGATPCPPPRHPCWRSWPRRARAWPGTAVRVPDVPPHPPGQRTGAARAGAGPLADKDRPLHLDPHPLRPRRASSADAHRPDGTRRALRIGLSGPVRSPAGPPPSRRALPGAAATELSPRGRTPAASTPARTPSSCSRRPCCRPSGSPPSRRAPARTPRSATTSPPTSKRWRTMEDAVGHADLILVEVRRRQPSPPPSPRGLVDAQIFASSTWPAATTCRARADPASAPPTCSSSTRPTSPVRRLRPRPDGRRRQGWRAETPGDTPVVAR